MRLVDGGTEYEGRVEVFDRCLWGAVSGEDWSIKEANIVCRQLGYPSASYFWTESLSQQSLDSEPVVFAGFSCQGNELSLEECYDTQSINAYSGRIDRRAGVRCLPQTKPPGKENAQK